MKGVVFAMLNIPTRQLPNQPRFTLASARAQSQLASHLTARPLPFQFSKLSAVLAAPLQAQSQLASYSFVDCVQTLLGETIEVGADGHVTGASACWVDRQQV